MFVSRRHDHTTDCYFGTFAAQFPIRLRGGPDAALGMGRDSVVVLTIDRNGAVHDTIGVFASRMIEVQMRDVGANRMRLPGTLPFTPRTVVAGGAAAVVVANTDAVDVKRFQPDGTLRLITRSAAEAVPVEERHRDYIVDSLRARFAGNLNGLEVRLLIRTTETTPLPESFPVYDSLAVDTDGNLWLTAFRLPGDTTIAWTVYENDGSLVGLVRGPTGFRATEFGSDYVLGVTSGALASLMTRSAQLGASTSSESRNITHSPVARAKPPFIAAPSPPFGCCTSWIWAP